MAPSAEALILACGPRAGGNSDMAAELLAQGLAEAGVPARLLHLRDAGPLPCVGCQGCSRDAGYACPFMDQDGAEEVFERIKAAPLLFFASPIYFYHLPGQFKGFIDRSQRHYEAWAAGDLALRSLPPRTAHACLVAGRPRGEKLFDGALLTLKYFLRTFNVRLGEPLTLMGLDGPDDLRGDSDARGQVLEFARRAAVGAGLGAGPAA
ncbi:flavodoxin family protein [Fundidesulfovibrio soli]|uniref:flavodoxin family protein n=1 Tax=Fundidesulfovibrio soli TaxID=2922716 RepID=UPI001FB013D2|nr:flavodoxin family protein [Fundidesulfovibrio soli]